MTFFNAGANILLHQSRQSTLTALFATTFGAEWN